MKLFMVVGESGDERECFTKFADTYAEASTAKQSIECGLGGYAEIYAREKGEGGYEYRLFEA